MGIDLSLLPIEHESTDRKTASSVLQLMRDGDLFDLIREIPQTRLTGKFESRLMEIPGELDVPGLHYNRECFGETKCDSYEASLQFCLAKDFSKLLERVHADSDLMKSINPWNLAALEYCTKLSGETKVVLYWW